jgi:hypothetical protein
MAYNSAGRENAPSSACEPISRWASLDFNFSKPLFAVAVELSRQALSGQDRIRRDAPFEAKTLWTNSFLYPSEIVRNHHKKAAKLAAGVAGEFWRGALDHRCHSRGHLDLPRVN